MDNTHKLDPGHNPGRRDFLRTGIKLGTGTTLALGLLSSTTLLTACGKTSVPAAQGYQFLKPQHITMLKKIFPVMLPMQNRQLNLEQYLLNIDGFIHNTSPQNSKALLDVLDMVSTGFTRTVLLRRLGSWEDFTESDIKEILTGLQYSSIGLIRLIYRTINTLVYMQGYYSEPDTWESIGYPGPPRKLP